MYARRKGTDKIGDVLSLGCGVVTGTLHDGGKRFRWKTGKGNVELIEHSSFNPKSPNYQKNGKVERVV